MNSKVLDRFKKALVDENIVTSKDLNHAESEARFENLSLGRALVKLGCVTEEKLSHFVAKKLGLPYVDLRNYTIDPQALELVPAKTAKKLNVLPLFFIDGVLTVAIADPSDVLSVDEIASVAGCKVESVVASYHSVRASINQWYGLGDDRKRLVQTLCSEIEYFRRNHALADHAAPDLARIQESCEQEETVQRVNSLLVQAVLEAANGVHFGVRKDSVEVGFRIDGVLFHRADLTRPQYTLAVARLKSLAGLDIATRRRPQHGSFQLKIRNRNIDLGVSTLPTIHGESTVLAIIDKSRGAPDLSGLGLSEPDLVQFRRAIQCEHGLIVASGPPSSGRTTTLYAALRARVSAEEKIVSIEEAIRYESEGIAQTIVDASVGLSFAEALRAALRQDPDVVLVGDANQAETLDLAIQASLSGQLVLCRMNGTTAFDPISKCYDLGVSPGLLSSVLNLSFTQRVVRKNCPRCLSPHDPDVLLLEELGLPTDHEFFRGQGCGFCSDTGYKDHLALFELLPINKDLRRLISTSASEEEIMDVAWSQGMRSLLDDGVAKVLDGATTVDELKRVWCAKGAPLREPVQG